MPLIITRIFNAPRAKIWEAWTQPEICMKWYGPKDFTAPDCQIDLRVGGRYLNCMQAPDGNKFWSTGTYTEIVPMEKLSMTDSFADEHGNVVPASHYGMGDEFPVEMKATVTFEDLPDGQTKMTLIHEGLPEGEIVEQTHASWNESFDKLDLSLAG